MRLPALLLPFALLPVLHAAEPTAAPADTLDRVLAAAQKSSTWRSARTHADRFNLLRDHALNHSAVSDPVSDRYLITALAGPVDLVHFFGAARTVCSGTSERRPALLHLWQSEGGADFGTRLPSTRQADATPDDLPSDALGALFGEEMLPHNASPGHDLAAALRAFLAPLEPVPDSIAKSFDHEQVVLGLKPGATDTQRKASREWFTASPLYLLPVIDPARAKTIPDAAAALTAAGLVLRKHQDQAIILDRIGTPEPVEPRISKAIPVRENTSKAVPVE